MRIALCRPSASSQSVFQKTPGRRSTHGTVLTSTNTLTDGVITGGLSGDTSAGLAQRLLDRFPERLDRQGAFDLAPVDEERGRGPHAGLAALALISQDRILEARGVEALRERLGVEPQPTRVAQQVLAREVGLGQEQQVVVLPVPRPSAPAGRGATAAGTARLCDRSGKSLNVILILSGNSACSRPITCWASRQ